MSASGSTSVIFAALFANLAIAVSKFAGAFFSGSASLLAEAIHSLVDCANQVLLLVGKKSSERAPTDAHPLGYGREAFFWSFVVAILLFSLGGLFAIYEGVHKLSDVHGMESPWIALLILLFGIVMEWFSFQKCLKEIRHVNTYGSLLTWVRKTTSSELLVIFTEDLAALLGLMIAFTCIIIAWLTGDARWDAFGSIFVGSLLVIVATLLAVEIKSLIIGETPSYDYRTEIEKILEEHIPGARILRFLAIQIGVSEVLVSYKIYPGEMTQVDPLIRAINDVERRVKTRFPEIQWQFVEPDHVA